MNKKYDDHVAKIITHKRKNGTLRVQTETQGPSRTQQHHRDHVNINNIVAKYRKGELVTHINKNQGFYGDFAHLPDYAEALQTVIYAQDAFQGLPADLRKRFGNDPQQLIEFLSDSNNLEEATKLGLVVDKKQNQNNNENQNQNKNDKQTNSKTVDTNNPNSPSSSENTPKS